MKETYQNIFFKINEIEENILNDLIDSHIFIDEIPEILITTKMMLTGLVGNKRTIENYPTQKLDQYLCLLSCAFNVGNLKNIPHLHVDWVKCHLDEPVLKYVRHADQTEYICLKLIELDYRNVKYVNPDILTHEFLLMATALRPKVILELNIQVFNPDLFEAALESNQFDLSCLPVEWKRKDICDRLFEKNHLEILNFPKGFVEVEQIKTALNLSGSLDALSIFNLFEVGQYDEDLIVIAVEKNEKCLKLVDESMITRSLISKLGPHLKNYETLVSPFIDKHLDQELCFELINHNAMLLYGIPSDMRNFELCLKAITLNPMSLGAVPISLADDELYKIAVKKNGLALCHVPTPYRDHEIPYIAVAQNGEALEFVPDDFKNDKLCKSAVKENPYAIYSVPKRLRDLETFKLAINHVPEVLKFMPEDMRDLESCTIAVKQDRNLLEYVPVDIRESLMTQKLHWT